MNPSAKEVSRMNKSTTSAMARLMGYVAARHKKAF